jgi:serine/threonine-protein kinase RsbW
MTHSLVCTFGHDIEAPRAARCLVGEALGAEGSPELLADAQLVVSELVANVLLLRVTPRPHGLRVEVDDTTNDPPVVMATPGSVLPHGRGMQIVAGLAETWGVEWRWPRGKTVWAELSA